MFIQAKIAVAKKEGWLVPESAVVQWGNQKFIFVETSAQSFEMKPVKIITEQAGFILLEMNPDLKNKNILTKNAYAALMLLQNKAEEE